jgi:hypothetical protein
MPLPLVLHEIVEQVGKRLETTDPLVWVRDEPTQEDLDHILKEGSEGSKFDPYELRKTVLEDLREGRARLITKSCAVAKVLAIVYPGQVIPWELFGRIFQTFGAAPARAWRIVWFANPTVRALPPQNTPASAEHLNGGYAFPCRPETVIIYRYEEVARVLVHELLHAACTDNMDEPVELRETKTEVWAELFLVAIQARGRPRIASRLWAIQAQWIANQEAVLRIDHATNAPSDYAYRYTVGRREFLETLGIRLPQAGADARAALGRSLRFTSPSLTQ